MLNQSEIIEKLRSLMENNQSEFPIVKIGLFGSVARDEHLPYSDIDVVVQLEKQDLYVLIGIQQALEAIFGTPVDIVSYRHDMNPFLKSRIDAEAVYA